MQTTLNINHLNHITNEFAQGNALYFNFDMGNGGVSDLFLIPLTRRRLLVGRRSCGGMLFNNIQELLDLHKTPSGNNDLHIALGDSLYLGPLLIALCSPQMFTDCYSFLPVIPLDGSAFYPLLNQLIENRSKMSSPVIEFSVSYRKENMNEQPFFHSVFFVPSWKAPTLYRYVPKRDDSEDDDNQTEEDESDNEEMCFWYKRRGFGMIITGIGAWTYEGGMKIRNDYIYEKLSLYRTELSVDCEAMHNLIKIIRAMTSFFE